MESEYFVKHRLNETMRKQNREDEKREKETWYNWIFEVLIEIIFCKKRKKILFLYQNLSNKKKIEKKMDWMKLVRLNRKENKKKTEKTTAEIGSKICKYVFNIHKKENSDRCNTCTIFLYYKGERYNLSQVLIRSSKFFSVLRIRRDAIFWHFTYYMTIDNCDQNSAMNVKSDFLLFSIKIVGFLKQRYDLNFYHSN